MNRRSLIRLSLLIGCVSAQAAFAGPPRGPQVISGEVMFAFDSNLGVDWSGKGDLDDSPDDNRITFAIAPFSTLESRDTWGPQAPANHVELDGILFAEFHQVSTALTQPTFQTVAGTWVLMYRPGRVGFRIANLRRQRDGQKLAGLLVMGNELAEDISRPDLAGEVVGIMTSDVVLRGPAAFDGTGTSAVDNGLRFDEHAELSLAADRAFIRPGDTVDVSVWLDTPVTDVRGYALEAVVVGGQRGRLQLVDVFVDEDREHLFDSAADGLSIQTGGAQLRAELQGDGVPAMPGAYLATFRLRASRRAAGTFFVEFIADQEFGGTRMLGSAADSEIPIHKFSGTRVVVQGRRSRHD